MPRALPRAGFDPKTRGARRGSVFTTAARRHPRNASSFRSQRARARRLQGPSRIELGGGAPHFRSSVIARSSESERPGTKRATACPPCGGAETKCVDRGRANPACQRRAPGNSARRRAAENSERGSDSLHDASLASPLRGAERRRFLPATCSAEQPLTTGERGHGHVSRRWRCPAPKPLRPRARVNGSRLHGDRSAFARRASLPVALLPTESESRARSRATRHLARFGLTPSAPAIEDQRAMSDGRARRSPVAPSARARVWLRGGPSYSNACTLRHARRALRVGGDSR